MAKYVALTLFIMLALPVSGEETASLKLRTHDHRDFLRIVFEGDDPLIANALVNQKGNTIIVRFPQSRFTVETGEDSIPYKKYEDRVLFSPGNFTKLKAFSLKHPSRLVIDIYLQSQERYSNPVLDAIRERWRKKAGIPAQAERPKKAAQTARVVVIDPGHGGYEDGIAAESYKEKNVVLDIAKRLGALIDRGTNQSFLTRKSDQSLSLTERVKLANSREPDIFLSLHIGKHDKFFIYTPLATETVSPSLKPYLENRGQDGYEKHTTALGNAMKRAIADEFGSDMVSARPLPYSVLSRIEAAALMIELPSFDDAHYIPELKTELANTLYKGIYLYEEESEN